MSQDYLTFLLNTPEHRVQGECVICLEPYNTMNTTTGIIELEIRLGCGHTFGSACIVTWLRDNNGCPLCRTTFFPGQPRPYLEHGIMDTGGESTGRINATGSISSEPNAVRSVTVPASSELEPPADSRTRIIDASMERRVNLPTGPEVPRSSPVGGSRLDRSSTIRHATGSEVVTGSDTRNSNAGRSNTVRASTGSDLPTNSVVRGLRDLNIGRSRIPTSVRTDNSRTTPVMSTTSHTRNSGFDRPGTVGLPTEPVTLADRVFRNFAFMGNEIVDTTVELAEKLAALMPVHLQSQDSNYMDAVCCYIASHLLHKPKSAQQVAAFTRLSLDRIRSIYALVYPTRAQLIDVETLKMIAGDHLEGLLAFLPPPDGENVIIDEGEQRLRELQRQNTFPQRPYEDTNRLCTLFYPCLGSRSVFKNCMDVCQSGVVDRRLGLLPARLKVAVGLFMGTNLLGIQVSCQQIGNLLSINENALRAAYARIHPEADQILRPSMLENIGRENMPRALEAVPTLKWPPLNE